MNRGILIFALLVNCADVEAQFTYLNQIIGEQGDLYSEHGTNLEVVANGYVIWGSGINDNMLLTSIKKYDLFGNLINENILYDDSAEYVYAGLTKSFQWNPYTETFVFMQGVNLLGQGILEGYLIEFDSNLDTTFTRRYNQFPPYTYLFTFYIESDSYIVVGETTDNPNSAGTFIMKLDFEGNVLWSEVLQPLYFQDIYRNWSMEKLENGYLIAGGGKTAESGYEPFGLLTITNALGETTDEFLMVDEDMPKSYSIISTKLNNGEIVLAQAFGYELVSEIGNPNVFWTKTRLSKYDHLTSTLSNEVEYFDDYNFFSGGAYKMQATLDGGILLVGSYYGFYFDRTSWMLKVDSNLNQEWFHEYSYETCNDCANTLYDVELAPDGGYVAAGSFVNYDVDPRNSTWLLKVDACGDVEWQGCELLGLSENQPNVFKIYPNPNTGSFTLENGTQTNLASWKVYDVSGRSIASGNSNHHATSLQIDINVPSGMYNLELVMENGERENHKIQVIK